MCQDKKASLHRWSLIRCRPLNFVTLGIAGHLAVGPADLGKVVSVDVSDWIHTNALTVSASRRPAHNHCTEWTAPGTASST